MEDITVTLRIEDTKSPNWKRGVPTESVGIGPVQLEASRLNGETELELTLRPKR